MSLLKKKHLLILAGISLVLIGASVAVFWPEITAYRRCKEALAHVEVQTDRVEVEFPELANFEKYTASNTPKSNGWHIILEAQSALEKVESSSDLKSMRIVYGRRGYVGPSRALDFETGGHDHDAMQRILEETETIRKLLLDASKYEFVVSPPMRTEGALSADDVLSVFQLSGIRATLLSFSGQQDQAEVEYLGDAESVLQVQVRFNGAGVGTSVFHTHQFVSGCHTRINGPVATSREDD